MLADYASITAMSNTLCDVQNTASEIKIFLQEPDESNLHVVSTSATANAHRAAKVTYLEKLKQFAKIVILLTFALLLVAPLITGKSETANALSRISQVATALAVNEKWLNQNLSSNVL